MNAWRLWGLSKVVRAAWWAWSSTWRDQLCGAQHLSKPAIFVCWHQGILGSLLAGQRLASRGVPLSPLASNSRDGQMIARVLRDLSPRIEVVRGSSGRGGTEAREHLEAALAAGRSPVLTVDGPRGPRHEAKPGAVWLAWRTGIPLVPIAWAATRELTIERAWDGFRIPLPGGRLRVALGPSLHIPVTWGEHNLGFWVARLETRLHALDAALAPWRRHVLRWCPPRLIKHSPHDTAHESTQKR